MMMQTVVFFANCSTRNIYIQEGEKIWLNEEVICFDMRYHENQSKIAFKRGNENGLDTTNKLYVKSKIGFFPAF